MARTLNKLSAKSRAEPAIARLRAAQLKITEPRRRIVSFLSLGHGPYTIEDICVGISGTCDQSTVYRVINQFVEAGVVRRSDLRDGIARFELSAHQHPHHHLICKSCKRVEAFTDARIQHLDKIAKTKGFSSIDPWIEIFGICQDCQS